MPDTVFPVEMVGGVPVVTTPEQVDITNADGLRAALLESAGHGQLVVDMSRTEFCDTAGLHALVAAHKQALAEGGELRLVVAGAAVQRIFAITGLSRVIPGFTSLQEALTQPRSRTGFAPPS
ncbi:MAG TPA: STAS domain-containing protein [Streptosporangiaceae bacterium]|nr:STAS domain-containing protein [Streptosporangiaceae bacterium]